MRGVQYLTDYQGNLKSVLINLQEHQAFWQDVLAEIDKPIDFQFLINEKNQQIAVLLELPKHEELWEDVYDTLITDDLENEPSIAWEEFKQELQLNK